MAQLGNLLVKGSSRLLGKLFCEDISVGNSLSVKTLSTTNFTATSITTSGLAVNGNATTTGTLNVGNSRANGKISVNGKVVIRDYGNSWLGINDGYAESWLSSGIYFGKSTIRTDATFQLGENGNKILFNTTSAKFSIPVTINNSLAANNITVTNVTVNDTLKAFKYELNTIQDLGGEFCVAPTIYIQSGATVNVSKASATTITVSILDKTAITSDSIQGVRWAQNSKIKFQGKIDGLNIRCSGVMAAKLNTTANTMSLTLTVEPAIADHFTTAKNGASYSDISVMLYQRYGKKIGSITENVYSPVGIRMSATGNANSAPYVDIWGSKSNSDPDTVYTVPSVRLGYLDGLKCDTYDCAGYGLYADNVYLNGTIISNSGQLGGFKIGTNNLSNGTWGTDKSVLMSTGTTENKTVGGSSAISGWCFTAGSKFGVTTNGDLYASNANISGTITSEKGSIGGFTISQYNIKGTNVGFGCADGHDYAFWAGNSTGLASPFRVSHDGSLVASKATITGTITTEDLTATGGNIGGFGISDALLFAKMNTGKYFVMDCTRGNHDTNTAQPVFSVGGTDTEHTNALFLLDSKGNCVMKKCDATDFSVTNLTATGGKIGGWEISSEYLSNNSTFNDYDYSIKLSSILTSSSTSSTNISDQAFLKCETKKDNSFISSLQLRPTGQAHFYGNKSSKEGVGASENGYSILSGNGISIYNSSQDTLLFDTVIFSNATSKNNFGMYSQNVCTQNIHISNDVGVLNPTYTTEGIVNDKITILNDALRVNGNIYRNDNLIGETLRSATTKKTVANVAWTNITSITLPPGVYVLIGTNAFDASKGGRLGSRFATASTGYNVTAQVIPGMPLSMTSWVQCQWIVSHTEEITYYLQAFQQTGANLAVTGDIKAVRIA